MSAKPAAWWDAVRDRATVADVAGELGMIVTGRRGIGPCPACNAERRGHADRRPPVGVRADGRGWACFGCGATGDALDLATWRLAGAKLRDLDPARRGEVRAWFAGRGWCDGDELSPLGKVAFELFGEWPPKGDPRWREAGRELRRREAGAGSPQTGPGAREPQRGRSNGTENPPAELPGLDAGEVAALWAAGRPLDGPGCGPVGDWLRDVRGLTPAALAVLDLARVLPDAYPWPAWLPLLGMDRAAWLARYRLAAPMYDAAGELRALRFRAVDAVREPDPDAPDNAPRLRWRKLDVTRKALSPKGARLAGLVLADPWGLALLRGAREVDGVPWDGAVLVAEGEPDLWAAASSAGRFRAAGTFAGFAVVAGSWTADIAARIPDGARVTVATDADQAGDGYAEAVRASLNGRCTVRRMARPETWRDNAS
jgi:hypothetical protein